LVVAFSKAAAKVLLFFGISKYFCKKMQFFAIIRQFSGN